MTVIMQKASAFCRAILFGTSSPNTRLKNIKISVTPLWAICPLYGIPTLCIHSARTGEMLDAADADE